MEGFAKNQLYSLTRKDGGNCPDCGNVVDLPKSLPTGNLSCPACGWEGSWRSLDNGKGPSLILQEKPSRSQISEKENSEGREWLIPSKKRLNFFLIFGLFFGGFPLLILILTFFGGKFETSLGLIGTIAFFSIFILIGSAVFYIGLRLSFTELFLSIKNGEALLIRKLLGRKSIERLAADNFTGVGLYESHESNNIPVYGLMLRAREGKPIKFGVSLKEDEKRWLGGRILETLPDQAAAGNLKTAHFPARSQSAWTDIAPEKEDFRGVSLQRQGSGFRMKISASRNAKSMTALGIFMVIFGSGFAWIGFSQAGFPFNILGLSFAAIGLGVLGRVLWTLGGSRVFDFGREELVVKTIQRSQEKSRQQFSRSTLKEGIIKKSGESNSAPRHSMYLTGDKEVQIFLWIEPEIAHGVAKWIEWWLAGEKSAVTKDINQGIAGYGAAISTEVSKPKTRSVPRNRLPIYSDAQTDLSASKSGRWALRAFAGIFFVVGLVVLYFGIIQITKGRASAAWPAVAGVITHSEMDVNSDSDGTTYGADVSFSYQVKDTGYSSDKVSFGDFSSSDRRRARGILKQYPVGKKVSVHYDPAKPSEAVLEPGLKGGTWLLPGIGTAIFLTGLIFLITLEHQFRRKRRDSPI